MVINDYESLVLIMLISYQEIDDLLAGGAAAEADEDELLEELDALLGIEVCVFVFTFVKRMLHLQFKLSSLNFNRIPSLHFTT